MAEREVFYVKPEDVSHDSLILRDREIHHLVNVRRKNTGDFFIAVDGNGTAYDCLIASIAPRTLQAKILKKHRFYGEPLFKLTLAAAIHKKARFEWVIEKATEIGVATLIPLLTIRTVMSEQALKPQRFERISISAMKQSCRSSIPQIEPPIDFTSLCETSTHYDIKLLAHEKELDISLNDIILRENVPKFKSGIVCIGPEGGFTTEEVELAKSSDFSIFGLGPRRLRAETAALIAVGLILDRMGELQ